MKRTDVYPPLVKYVQQFMKEKELLKPRQKIIVAVSGGIDSVVLLDVLVQLSFVWDLELVVAHVNHRLRGKESSNDEKFVRQLAKNYGISCSVEQVNTKEIAKKQKLSLQTAARNIRYSFFENLKKSLTADLIATAHNANDNAETMLMNVLRGSGIEGLTGIPFRRNDIVRPLLHATRNDIERYAKKRKLNFREDSSNLNDDYTRNYLRRNILPKLERRLNPSLVETLLNESVIFRSNLDFINTQVDKVFVSIVAITPPRRADISVEKLIAQHPFIRQMIVQRTLKELNIEPNFVVISSIIGLVTDQKGKIVEINKQWAAERAVNDIRIRQASKAKNFSYTIEKEGTIATEEFVFSIKKSAIPDNKRGHDSSIEYIDASLIEFPIIVRSWQRGDAFVPLGMKGRKKVSDFFVDSKLSNTEKHTVPIIESDGRVVWIAGHRLDDRFKLTSSTTDVYQLTLTVNHGKKNGPP